MLEEIRISGLGVIDDAALELGPGLTVITGETGAGKTMVLQGLHLLLGGRADSGVVRNGAARASVDGTVVLKPGAPAHALLDEIEASVEDERVILSRSITSEGRSKAVIGGRAAPVSSLSELADGLIVVHGQSDQIRLLKPGHQRELLDRFGVEGSLLSTFADAYAAWRALGKRIATLESDAGERTRRIEQLREDLARIDAAAPQPGELDAVGVELERLSHAESLHEAARLAHLALTGDPDDPTAGGDATSAISLAAKTLSNQGDRDPALAAIAVELAKAGSVVEDAAHELSRYVDSLDADPQRLEFLQQRKATLTALVRRHGDTFDDLLAYAASSRTELDEIGDDDVLPRLRDELAAAAAKAGKAATKLHDARLAAAKKLAVAMEAELGGLGMPTAKLDVQIATKPDAAGLEVKGESVAVTSHGADEVEILLAAHPGAAPRPLSKGASGGELSRVMLALEVALAGSDPVPTMVFDEVDAGVGGRAAIEVGARLARLARDHQVICVTHLAQVAAFADHHVVVRKSNDGLVTSTDVSVIGDDERLVELSRMLSGVEESDHAQAHAQELRELALAQRKATK